jgi:heterodisulfide reductase subunit A
VATGFDLFDCSRISEYGYGRYDNVLSSLQLERLVDASGPTRGRIVLKDGREPESLAIVHCVGSRDKKYNRHCSRICCMYSLKLAHLVKDATGAQVYEFYIDMRTGGKGYEEFYERLQEEGVIFIRGRPAEIVPHDGRLLVKAEDANLGRLIQIPVDMVILSAGLEPRHDAADVSHLFGFSRSGDGFFLEKHPKLAPVETASNGVFIAGACQGPKDIPDTVAQAGAAAAAAMAMMDQGKVTLEPSVAQVNIGLCTGCGECVVACPYSALELVEGHVEVDETACKGCGVCAGHCRSKAITVLHFTDEQLLAEMQGALRSLEVA